MLNVENFMATFQFNVIFKYLAHTALDLFSQLKPVLWNFSLVYPLSFHLAQLYCHLLNFYARKALFLNLTFFIPYLRYARSN